MDDVVLFQLLIIGKKQFVIYFLSVIISRRKIGWIVFKFVVIIVEKNLVIFQEFFVDFRIIEFRNFFEYC